MKRVLAFVLAVAVGSCPLPTSAQPIHATCNTATVQCGEQIVRATYNEFPGLANDGTNGAAMEELLRRMIWHLQLNGLQAARQQNPSGRVSTDKLAAFIDGQWRAYDVLSDRADPGPFSVQFNEIPGVNPRPDWPLGPLADEGGVPPPPPPPPGGSPTDNSDHNEDTRAELAAIKAEVQAVKTDVAAVKVEVTGVRVSLEEHRAEARATKSAVLGWLGNWKNLATIGATVLGMLGIGAASN